MKYLDNVADALGVLLNGKIKTSKIMNVTDILHKSLVLIRPAVLKLTL
jgi:hypothetical protein